MCGRYQHLSDKQRIAEAFSVKVGLDEIYCDPEANISPGSLQPVIYIDENGKRRIEMMRWGFQLPDRLQFLARSETVDRTEFWKESFRERRSIEPVSKLSGRTLDQSPAVHPSCRRLEAELSHRAADNPPNCTSRSMAATSMAFPEGSTPTVRIVL